MNEKQALTGTPGFSTSYRNTRLDDSSTLEQYHDSCEVAFFLRADIKVFIKDKQYEIKDGDIMFMSEYEVHKIIYSSGMCYERYVVNFKKNYIYKVLQALDIGNLIENMEMNIVRRARLTLKEQGKFERLFKELPEEDGARPSDTDNAVSADIKIKLVQLLVSLKEVLGRAGLQDTVYKPQIQVQKILAYIDLHFAGPITLDGLKKEFYLSRYYISHIFKKTTGFTVIGYLQLRRIIEAQNLLRHSQKSIIEICFCCGFNNIQHFCRIFKRTVNMTPYKYRRLHTVACN